jgi:predicted CopG family antitoxin
MKDKLEKFILEHRNDFDVYEPSEEVWGKIEKNQNKRLQKTSWKGWLWKAAAILVIFGSSLIFFEMLHYKGIHIISLEKEQEEVVIPELKEAEMYYSSIVEEKMREIKPMLTEHPGMDKEINKDLSELDSMYTELKKDLKDNIATGEVVHALIENYRMRIDILEEILSELSEDEQLDTVKVNEKDYEI